MGKLHRLMLGAVLPLVVSCGSSDSTDDRELFGVTYRTPEAVETEDGLPLFRRTEVLCNGQKETDGVLTAIQINLGMTAVLMQFSATWINNELDDQDVVLTGDGFRLSIYALSTIDGSREEEPVWHSDFDYSEINLVNGNDGGRYLQSLANSGFDNGRAAATEEEPLDETIYSCDDNDEDGVSDRFSFFHSGGDTIGINSSVGGDEIVGDDQQYTITIPQSDTLPGIDTVGHRGAGFTNTAGTYFWWGYDNDGQPVDVGVTYEAELEVRVCPVGIECEEVKNSFQFRLADKAE